ncbi:PREDICTED: chymotrypsin-2-like [Ceratosolen solmsi marchali]|uniref:Chymotrypsin-2-like n=1 Tax=Ceratosolen solmsi marchali TaxID=326594 RepID=A0AAJ6VLR9_9HYME|nr:PREDICTED: chymotrypsin-2-like [Ceratosolen solmsi marchali]
MELKVRLLIAQCLLSCIQYGFIEAMESRGAREGEFPFVVSIKKQEYPNRPDKDHVCSGVLISNKDVLTIERCQECVTEGATEILYGSVNLKAGFKRYPLWWMTYVQWAHIKNKQLTYQQNQLAIIRLNEPVPASIKIAEIQTTQNSNLYGSLVQTAGWGALMIGMTPRLMRTTSLTVLTNEQCQQKINRLYPRRPFQLQPTYLCTNGDHEEQHWHLMDFGGPLIFDDKVIAINQDIYPMPTNPPHPEKLNLHIRLDYYSDFIRDVTNNF